MQHPDRLRRPHPGVHQAKVDARLSNIEGDLGHIEADVKDLGKLWWQYFQFWFKRSLIRA